MLNRNQLKSYREIRGLSQHDVANYCNLSQPMIAYIENGERNLTEESHEEFCKGINDAFAAKCNGTLKKTSDFRKEKEEAERQARLAAMAEKEKAKAARSRKAKVKKDE